MKNLISRIKNSLTEIIKEKKWKMLFSSKKRIVISSTCILLIAALIGTGIYMGFRKDPNDCVDGSCDIPEFDENGNQVYAIVSPVGYNNIEEITQAPRLDTLSGKKIALVGGSFMASVTHAELKKCILQKYPDAQIFMFNEVGSGGPYSVFGKSAQTEKFEKRLQELGIDAVISGNCGCGLCTTKESGSAIAAEYIGIPTVTVGAPTFIAQIHSTGVNRGVPVLRTAEYPNAFASESNAALQKNTREIVWPQVEKALTEEITQKEIDTYAGKGERPFDEIVYYGSYDDIQEYCKINDWTDGKPIVPPTDKLIKEYLKFTPYKAEDELGTYALAYRKCLVYTVAANAVMAGVPKEYMPICIAITQSLENGEWRRPLASTHGWSPYAWLNGPLARQLGIDHEQGMISEQNNQALGRFIEFAMLNLGGYYVKENRMGTFGYLTPWTFSEDEETCLEIGWEPYHVSKGYELNSNTVTAASALSWGNNVTPATDDPQTIMNLMAFDITEKQQNGLGNTNPQVYRTVFITAPVAKALASGYATKGTLEDALITAARRPLYMRAYANYWANTGSRQSDKYTFQEYINKLQNDTAEQAALTATPDWLKGVVGSDKIMTIATMNKGETPLLITGDSTRNKFMTLPGGGYITNEIKLPKNWNELVAPLGYQPIENFYLGTDEQKKEAEKQTETKGESGEAAISVTSLPDGTYRLTPSAEQVTGEGRAYYKEGEMLISKGSSTESIKLKDKELTDLLDILNPGCSIVISNKTLSEIIIRPTTITKKPISDLSGLEKFNLEGVKILFTVNAKKSAEGGGVTPSGVSVILPASLKSFGFSLGGEISGSNGFVSISGNRATVDPNAAAGETVSFTGGGTRTMTFTKNQNGTVTASYATTDNQN